MSIFGLPTGEFDLLLKKKGRGRHKEEWKNVMFTDFITQGEIAECVERCSENYKKPVEERQPVGTPVFVKD